MSGNLRPICVKCGREMGCEKNEVVVVHPMEHAEPGPVQKQSERFTQVNVDALFEGSWKEGDIDFVASGDKYRCPVCGFEVIVGCDRPIMGDQQRLKRLIGAAEEVVKISRS